MARKKREATQKRNSGQLTLAKFFTGGAQSFAGVQARLDRRAAKSSRATMTEHEQQQGADLLPQYGEYLLYSERERDRKAVNPAAKREGKKRKLIAKEKQNAQEFEAALGRMGLDFDSEAHVCI